MKYLVIDGLAFELPAEMEDQFIDAAQGAAEERSALTVEVSGEVSGYIQLGPGSTYAVFEHGARPVGRVVMFGDVTVDSEA